MNEQDYFNAWMSGANNQQNLADPTRLAIAGGCLCRTLEPAFIFTAGYQAAVRATFPDIVSDGWLAYAASEDRSDSNRKPGVTIDNHQLFGFKTWIAASRYVEAMILKVGRGADAQYVSVNALDSEVSITHKPTPGFLPALSQGEAEFSGAKYMQINDLSRVPEFADCEPYYIYLALLAALSEQPYARKEPLTGESIAEQARRILSQNQGSLEQLVTLDKDVQQLLSSAPFKTSGLLSTWGVDARLFSMYSKGLQARHA